MDQTNFAAPEFPSTPFLCVDAEVMDRNLAAMAGRAAAAGLSLRPHAKTHKVPEIARRQLELGAVGLTVATLGEAEVFAAAGCTDLFLAYPLWVTPARAARIKSLAARAALRIGVDSVEAARELGQAVAGCGVQVVVEVDSGHHRSGCRPDDAGTVAQAALDHGLAVAGVFTFPGHGYGPGKRGPAAGQEAAALATAAASLVAAGIPAGTVSGGSTPTAADADAGVLTELRPGVYAFNDAQQVELGSCGWDDVALTAVATVVSSTGRSVILDAGSKVLGADQPAWATGGGRILGMPGARITALSEHHATVAIPDGVPMPRRGDILQAVPNHVCAAVNLADELVVVRDGAPAGTWAVAARGRNN
ncbi:MULTISPECIES: alanine racemase [unclassified Arthrobacter]|uniref:alanine racemase n=1 Tax=unclassified Arthrobacter TaxID=235627 RepID=UPI00159E4EF1|nr:MULTISPECIES: alanine racemase [unclassified Arthrobacter]MCQ9162703.1 alanine racemase [Arthrobacter sp. STN4]NVM97314.1 D-TA family PLP-dependent enzyme [Arthrobacter sp. SDTb3-6]